MTILIAGAGFAGCLTALALARKGASCIVVEGGPRERYGPAADHAHRFRPDTLAEVATVADLGRVPSPAVGRPRLLQTLRGALEARADVRWGAKLRAVKRANSAGALDVTLTTGERVHADVGIDASGRAHALAERLAHFTGQRIEMDEIRDPWVYESRPLDRAPDGLFARPCGSGHLVYAVEVGAGVVTAMAPKDTFPGHETVIKALTDEIGRDASRLFTGVPRRAAGSALSVARPPKGVPVLCVGDALVGTPPRYGDGLSHALKMAQCVADASSLAEAGAKLDDYAGAVWSATSVAMALEMAVPRAVGGEGQSQ